MDKRVLTPETIKRESVIKGSDVISIEHMANLVNSSKKCLSEEHTPLYYELWKKIEEEFPGQWLSESSPIFPFVEMRDEKIMIGAITEFREGEFSILILPATKEEESSLKEILTKHPVVYETDQYTGEEVFCTVNYKDLLLD